MLYDFECLGEPAFILMHRCIFPTQIAMALRTLETKDYES